MNILDLLYTAVVGPLQLLIEVVFNIVYYFTQSGGFTVIVLSLFVNIIMLPMFNKADRIQAEQTNIEKELKPWVDKIKKAFSGDEQYMMLQTYYRQNNYKPYYSLKNIVSLLLEIPFFTAAYSFLSNLTIVDGQTFGPINNLAIPDGLLNGINILPILMTVINIVSSFIYTKGQSLKSKVQLVAMALVFMVILYDSPSILVLYWTTNNLFSLIKNIITSIDSGNKIVAFIVTIMCFVLSGYIVVYHIFNTKQQILVILILLMISIYGLSYLFDLTKNLNIKIKKSNKSFYVDMIFIALLIGLLIPSQLIKSSPSEFIDSSTGQNPISYIVNCFALSTGTFLIWCNIYYTLLNDNTKRIIDYISFAICIISLVDYMAFGTNLGTLGNDLVYELGLIYTNKEIYINCVVLVVIIILSIFFFSKSERITKIIFISGSIAIFVLSTMNLSYIQKGYIKGINLIYESSENTLKEIPLSKTKNNVVIITLDRAISSYFPYIIEEKPELQEQFSGFTYYPNTVSFGAHTNISIPSLYGGYEYTPTEINKRNTESLEEKHNEALKVLPVLFSEHDFDVIVCDPPYAGYSDIPDLSIYDEYEDISAYITMGLFKVEGIDYNSFANLKRNLFCYGIMKCSPVVLQSFIYNEGLYNMCDYDYVFSTYRNFINSYAVLDSLPSLTTSNNDEGTFFMIDNNTTHEAVILQEPNYVPSKNVNNSEYDDECRSSINGDELNFNKALQEPHYHANMASMIELGKWFDELRELGVYDNTKIIIASDHGYNLNQFEDMVLGEYQDGECYNEDDIMWYNPLLLVKDYNSKDLTTSNEFMTLGDVATIATNDTIENPTNPFTGKEINNNYKYDKEIKVSFSHEFDILKNNGNTYIDGPIYETNQNIFDFNNWHIVIE